MGKRIKKLSMEDDNLYSDRFAVPTLTQVEEASQPIHYGEKHCTNAYNFCKALNHKKFSMPQFASGLRQVCNM